MKLSNRRGGASCVSVGHSRRDRQSEHSRFIDFVLSRGLGLRTARFLEWSRRIGTWRARRFRRGSGGAGSSSRSPEPSGSWGWPCAGATPSDNDHSAMLTSNTETHSAATAMDRNDTVSFHCGVWAERQIPLSTTNTTSRKRTGTRLSWFAALTIPAPRFSSRVLPVGKGGSTSFRGIRIKA